MLLPGQKGAVAESGIMQAAARMGVPVWRPVFEGSRTDLILEVGRRLLRVQCKWAARQGDVVVVRCGTCRRGPNGFIRTTYSADEIELIGAYCAELSAAYLIPPSIFEGRSYIHLRLVPARNNQRRGVHSAREYEFAATLRGYQGP
jgi:hypothetical protein